MSHFRYIRSSIQRVEHVQWIEGQLGNVEHIASLATTPTLGVPASTTVPGDDASSIVVSSPGSMATNAGSKIVVMGRLSTEDTSWVSELQDWQNAIYVVDNGSTGTTSTTGLRTSINKAHEAMPYLTYITTNYPNFPDVIAFVHAHGGGYPKAWHNDAYKYSAVTMLRDMRVDTVRARGYVNLRCNDKVGCPGEIQPFRQDLDKEKHACAAAYVDLYGSFFNKSRAEMEREISVVATPCCAQFAVSREQILARPKADYERYLRLLEETEYHDDISGRVMEYMWHIIFGRDAVYCPDMLTCYCDVFGRCR